MSISSIDTPKSGRLERRGFAAMTLQLNLDDAGSGPHFEIVDGGPKRGTRAPGALHEAARDGLSTCSASARSYRNIGPFLSPKGSE